MQLHEALRQISDIRQRMARNEVFHGYRAGTVAFSGFAAVFAAAIQAWWAPYPAVDLDRYLALWLGVAAASVVVVGAEMGWRAWRTGSGLARQHTVMALEQFGPCVLVGALLTVCICRGAPQAAWMLPGLWSLVYGLGVFASHRLLPRHGLLVAFYYTLCGCGCLLWGQGDHVLSPWQMGASFGGGQLLGAAVLYWNLERTDVPTTDE